MARFWGAGPASSELSVRGQRAPADRTFAPRTEAHAPARQASHPGPGPAPVTPPTPHTQNQGPPGVSGPHLTPRTKAHPAPDHTSHPEPRPTRRRTTPHTQDRDRPRHRTNPSPPGGGRRSVLPTQRAKTTGDGRRAALVAGDRPGKRPFRTEMSPLATAQEGLARARAEAVTKIGCGGSGTSPACRPDVPHPIMNLRRSARSGALCLGDTPGKSQTCRTRSSRPRWIGREEDAVRRVRPDIADM